MDHERVTRSTIPTVSVTMPLSLKRWLDEEAERRGLNRSAFVAELIAAERDRCETAPDRELAAVAS